MPAILALPKNWRQRHVQDIERYSPILERSLRVKCSSIKTIEKQFDCDSHEREEVQQRDEWQEMPI